MIIPIIIDLVIFANVISLLKLGPSLKEISIIIGSITSAIAFIRFLKDEFPPILKEIEKDNKYIKGDTREIQPEMDLVNKMKS